MLVIIDSKILTADASLRTAEKKVYLLFEGAYATQLLNPGTSFSLCDDRDNQELDLLMELTGIMGTGWLSQLVGRKVRLIVYVKEEDRKTYRLSLEAIGHPTEDLFIRLNSGLPLCSADEAMKYIRENLQEVKRENN